MSDKQNEYGEGWFYGYSPVYEIGEIDDDGNTRGRMRDTRNVIGRFSDHQIIDGVASREARKAIYKPSIILEMKTLRASAPGGASQGTDVAAVAIRFDPSYLNETLENIKRFSDAWIAYQETRKAPVTDEERAGLEEIGIKAKAPKKPRKPRQPKNVVELKQAGA